MQMSPSCECCGQCVVARFDDGDFGSLTSYSGSWSASGGFIRTFSDFGQLIYDVDIGWTDQFFMSADFGSTTGNRPYRFIFCWTDSSNYWYCEWEWTAGSPGTLDIAVVQVVAGVESTMATKSGFSTTPRDFPELCYKDGWLHATAHSGTGTIANPLLKLEVNLSGGRFGIGTGDLPGTLEATIVSWTVTANTGVAHTSDCPYCAHGCCDEYELPETLTIVLAGFTAPYNVWNGNHTVYWREHSSSTPRCVWENPELGGTADANTPLTNPNGAKTGQSSVIRVTRNASTDVVDVFIQYLWADATSVSATGSGSLSGTFTESPCNDDWGGTISLSLASGTASITGDGF